ncbi:MAG: hypothetical protein M3264_06235 [Thermoproteota archaeon]|nr:hypothetical protein [Thermoproteota archaeon]
MGSQTKYHPIRVSIALGAIGGFVAGLVMVPLLMLTSITAGLSPSAIPFVLGLAIGADPDSAFIIGLILFLILSIVIGIAFGAITTGVKRLRITGIKKGIVEGIIAGIIAFAVLFVPLSLIVIPATINAIIQHMGLGITSQQTIAILSQALPIILGIGFVGWIIFGVVMGAVSTVLLSRFSIRKGGTSNVGGT